MQDNKPTTNITRIMPNKWSYNRKRRTSNRMRAKGFPENVIKEHVWGKW